MSRPDPHKARVLFNKGQNFFAAFFAEIGIAQREIGNDVAFATWCWNELHIPLSVIRRVTEVLNYVDSMKAKEDLAPAMAAEAHARKMEKITRENELAELRLKNVQHKAAEAEKLRKMKAEESKAKIKQRRAERAEQDGRARDRAKVAWMADPMATRDVIAERADVARSVASQARQVLEAEGRLPPKNVGTKSPDDEKSLYDEYVADGRLMMGHQWSLGYLAEKVSKLKSYGDGVLARFAYDIGAEYETLKQYRAVVQAWPDRNWHLEKGGRPPFSVASSLRSHPDRFAVFAGNQHMTCEEAREIMRAYKASSNVVPLK